MITVARGPQYQPRYTSQDLINGGAIACFDVSTGSSHPGPFAK
jgi:hypothetical protein